MESKKNNYFIGLDAETGSVGWAVTDEEYELLKFNGKDLWGMRCFETAQTARGGDYSELRAGVYSGGIGG